MPAASRTVEIDAPIETVFDVITDYASYPSFLDNVGTVTVADANDAGAKVTYAVEVLGKKVHYTLAMVHHGPNKVSWSLHDSNVMKQSDGSWELVDLGGRTKATYTVDVKPRGFVPGPVVKALTGRALPATVDAFKKRAESRTA